MHNKIKDSLSLQAGLVVSDIAVLKSMQRLKIKGYVRKQIIPKASGNEHRKFSNILNRNFNASKPLEKIVTDATYIKHKSKWYYLAVYMDLFNREILDFEISDTFDNVLVMKPAKRILAKTKSIKHPILLHSDQDIQYSSAGYTNLFKKYNVIQSMSRAGNPRDNAVIESFLARLKEVLNIHFDFQIMITFLKVFLVLFLVLIILNLLED